MIKHLVLASVLVSCGGDKCEKAWDKMAAAMSKEAKDGQAPDKKVMVEKCKDELKKRPEKEKMLDCIIALDGEVTIDKLSECSKVGNQGSFSDYRDRAKKTEAALLLNKIGKDAKSYFIEKNEFPKGSTGLTPAKPCCFADETTHKCPADPAMAQNPVWQALDFTIDEPHMFQYSYESQDGKTFTALAVGDLDCDSDMITYKAVGTSVDGNPKVEITEPTTKD